MACSNIGKVKPSDPPANVKYDDWVGPAPFVPFQTNRLHSSWRWFYNFGTGDMGNDGVHDIDVGRWGLGVDTHPTTITALGGQQARRPAGQEQIGCPRGACDPQS